MIPQPIAVVPCCSAHTEQKPSKTKPKHEHGHELEHILLNKIPVQDKNKQQNDENARNKEKEDENTKQHAGYQNKNEDKHGDENVKNDGHENQHVYQPENEYEHNNRGQNEHEYQLRQHENVYQQENTPYSAGKQLENKQEQNSVHNENLQDNNLVKPSVNFYREVGCYKDSLPRAVPGLEGILLLFICVYRDTSTF